jgi:hypothetical protein
MGYTGSEVMVVMAAMGVLTEEATEAGVTAEAGVALVEREERVESWGEIGSLVHEAAAERVAMAEEATVGGGTARC